MNGAQDMGGMHGFGPVVPEPNEPVFHAEWEKRAFALTLAMGMPGDWNIDMSRFARENRDPAEYLSMSYYQIWFAGAGDDAQGARPGQRRRDGRRPFAACRRSRSRACCRPATCSRCCIAAGRPSARPTRKPRSSPATACAPRTSIRLTHTRLPRYVRGHVGTIERVIGFHVFPDSNAQGAGENPQWLYTVRFDGRELWGADGDPTRDGLGRRLGAVFGAGLIVRV